MNQKFRVFQLSMALLLTSMLAFATPPPQVSVTGLVSSVDEAPGATAGFYFYRSSANSAGRLQLTLSWSGGATAADFVTALPTSVLIAAGSPGVNQWLEVFDDTLSEGTETVTCTIVSAVNLDNPGQTVNIGQASASVAIFDQDPPVVTVTAMGLAVENLPGRFGRFWVSRSTWNLSAPLTVYYTLSGTATGPGQGPFVDYTIVGGTSTSVTIPAGSASVAVEIHAIDDRETQPVESDEYVTMTLTGMPTYTLARPKTADIEILY